MFIVSFNMRLEPNTINDLESMLLTHEAMLERKNSDSEVLNKIAMANLARSGPIFNCHHRRNFNNQPSGFQNSPPQSRFNQQGQSYNTGRGNFRGAQNFQSRGRGRNQGTGRGNWKNNKPLCQACGKLGHTALQCYYRFDHSFTTPAQLQQVNSGSPVQGNVAQVQTYPKQYVQSEASSSQGFHAEDSGPYAMSATSDSAWFPTDDADWFPDSGATNHITTNIGHLNSMTDYHGNEQVHMGDGKGLSIKYVGYSDFNSNLFPDRTLCLNQLLHVPKITKNLLSGSKFANANRVFF